MESVQRRIPRRIACVLLPLLISILAIRQQPGPQRLSLKDAIDLGLKNNLTVVIAGTQVGEASGTTERARSALLPHVSDGLTVTTGQRALAVT
jgi:outer membrane protein TolC